jgi:hypothetical protein
MSRVQESFTSSSLSQSPQPTEGMLQPPTPNQHTQPLQHKSDQPHSCLQRRQCHR